MFFLDLHAYKHTFNSMFWCMMNFSMKIVWQSDTISYPSITSWWMEATIAWMYKRIHHEKDPSQNCRWETFNTSHSLKENLNINKLHAMSAYLWSAHLKMMSFWSLFMLIPPEGTTQNANFWLLPLNQSFNKLLDDMMYFEFWPNLEHFHSSCL